MPKTIPILAGVGPIVAKLPSGEERALPISQVVEASGLVFIAGQGGHLADRTLPSDGIEGETRVALDKVAQRLSALGLTFSDVVHVTVILAGVDDFATARFAMNDVYASYFEVDPPVRLLFGVTSLPGGSHVEIQVIAAR